MARKLLGESLAFDERLALAQLTLQPGWKVLVKVMAEACRSATEEVIRLEPGSTGYQERLAGLQSTARAMNKFSADVLDSVRVHQTNAVAQSGAGKTEERAGRFKGFKPPVAPTAPAAPESPAEPGKQSNQ